MTTNSDQDLAAARRLTYKAILDSIPAERQAVDAMLERARTLLDLPLVNREVQPDGTVVIAPIDENVQKLDDASRLALRAFARRTRLAIQSSDWFRRVVLGLDADLGLNEDAPIA